MSFPVDIQWVKETERKLGIRFPPSFVVAMTRYNGGSAQVGDDHYELFPFLDCSDRKRIRRTCSSICRETQSNRKWDHFPQQLVAIGGNGTGDLLVFAPSDEDPSCLQHTVYWYDHETQEIHHVADDFNEVNRS